MLRAIFFLLMVAAAPATEINYRSQAVPQDNLSAASRVELGYFENFTPTELNTDQWADHWNRIDGTEYEPSSGLFAGSVEYTGGASGSAYLWLADHRGDWVLLTNPDWRWPADPSPIAAPIDFFTTDPKTIAVVGRLTQGSRSSHLKTARFIAPSFDAIIEGWAEENDLLLADDQDNDGRNNLTEFLLQTSPTTPDPPFQVRLKHTGKALRIFLPTTPHPQAKLLLHTTSNLEDPKTTQPFVSILQNPPEKLFLTVEVTR